MIILKYIRIIIPILSITLIGCATTKQTSYKGTDIHNPASNTYLTAFMKMSRVHLLHNKKLYDVISREHFGDSLILQLQTYAHKQKELKGNIINNIFYGKSNGVPVHFKFSEEGFALDENWQASILPGAMIDQKDLAFYLKMSGTKMIFNRLWTHPQSNLLSDYKILWYTSNYGTRMRITFIHRSHTFYTVLFLDKKVNGTWSGRKKNFELPIHNNIY